MSWVLLLGGCTLLKGRPLGRFEFVEGHMGTPCRIVLYAPGEARAAEAARAAFAEIAAIDASMSDWNPESELSRLNASGESPVSVRLFEVLEASLRFAEISGGAFDPTVGPAVALWRGRRLPDEAERRAVLERIGWRHLSLDPRTLRVRLGKAGMKIDVGGIAKGHAADRALAILAERGIRSALADLGGDLAVGESPPGEQGWRVRLVGEPPATLLVRNRGVATSGDTERFIEVGGERYSHIVDPRTGLGIRDITAVTVVAPDGTTADALATAISVLGPERGIALAESLPGVHARVRSKDGTRDSSGFAAFLEPRRG